MGSFTTVIPLAGTALTSHQKPVAVAGLCPGWAPKGQRIPGAYSCLGLQRATAAVTEESDRARLPRHGVGAPRIKLRTRGCKMSTAHSTRCARHGTAPGHGPDRTRTPPAAWECAWGHMEHGGWGLVAGGCLRAPPGSGSCTPEPQLCRTGDEHFMVKYAEHGTKGERVSRIMRRCQRQAPQETN